MDRFAFGTVIELTANGRHPCNNSNEFDKGPLSACHYRIVSYAMRLYFKLH